MSERRKLTPDEKRKVEAWAYERERPKYPGAHVTITVSDEIDEKGHVHYRTLAVTEGQAPKTQALP